MPIQNKLEIKSAAFLAGMILFMAMAQILFKLAGIHAAAYATLHDTVILNPWLWGGLLTSSFGMGCWLLTLRRMPLASAYPWTALVYVLTPLASVVLFDDVLSGQYLAGLACIVVGVYLSAGNVRAS